MVLLAAGLIGIYKSNAITEEKLNEIMATSRQRALAFEAISLLSKGNLKGEGHFIDSLERKNIQLVIGKMEALQKALVNGDELYQIPFTKSQELTEKIIRTSPLLISSYDRLNAMLHLNGVWNTIDANKSAIELEEYASKMGDVTALIIQESEEARAFANTFFFLLVVVGALILFGVYFIAIKPLSVRLSNSEKVYEDAILEFQKVRQRWADSLISLSQQFRIPAFGFQDSLNKLSRGEMNERQKGEVIFQLESSADFVQELIENIRMIAEMESNGFQSHKSVIDLKSFLNSTIAQVQNIFGGGKYTIGLDISDRIPGSLMQDQQLLHHTIIQVLSYRLVVLQQTDLMLRVELLNSDAGLMQLKFSVEGKSEQNTVFSDSHLLMNDKSGLDITKKFVEKIGGRFSNENEATSFTVVFESSASQDSTDITKLKGLKAAMFLSDEINQSMLKKQLTNWGVYAVPFSIIGTADELEAALQKYDFCIADSAFLLKDDGYAIKLINRFSFEKPPVFFVLSTDENRVHLTHSFVRGILRDPIELEELLSVLLSFAANVGPNRLMQASSNSKPNSKLNFLVCYQDDLERVKAQRNVKLLGYRCDVAGTHEEAIASLGLNQYNVLVAESKFFSDPSSALKKKLKQLNAKGSKMVVIEINDSGVLALNSKDGGLIDQAISKSLGVKEVQSVVDEWFEV
jgi:hypothetical protein